MQLRCPSCHTTNRVDDARLGSGRRPLCGRCKQPLPVDAAPVTVTDATFAREVERWPTPVLVDAWAPWCGPCRSLAPVLDQIAAEMAGRLRVAKLNVDDNPATAARFGIQSIPTLLVMQGGREVDRIVGAQPKAAIVGRLQQVLG